MIEPDQRHELGAFVRVRREELADRAGLAQPG